MENILIKLLQLYLHRGSRLSLTVEEDELLILWAPFVDSEAVRHEHLGAEGGGARIKVGGIRTLSSAYRPLCPNSSHASKILFPFLLFMENSLLRLSLLR